MKDLTGKRFGKLLAVKNTGKQQNNCYVWECLCDCGSIIKVMSGSLGSGNTKSCGCVGIERMRKLGRARRLPNKQGLINAKYDKYKRDANKRNYSFDLSMKEFKSLILKDCFYCGSKPSQIFKGSTEGFNLMYTGIDRINNDLGYSYSNCVPCCKICNTMKLTLSFEDFLNHINKIITNIITTNEVEQ